MKRALWIIALAGSALIGVTSTGVVGLVSSADRIMAPPEASAAGPVATVPAAPHDPAKPTVAVVLGATRTEATDFLAPYAMFAASAAYNVYAVAASSSTRTLAGGVEVVPQLTFAELADRVPEGPDVIVVPAITHIDALANAPVLDWLRQQRQGATLFSWCVGAEVLAASGLIEGRPVTTHWGEIDRLEAAHPSLEWRRGVRYVDDGDLLTTGGITAGVDATLHFLATRDGMATAERVAQAIHYPERRYLDDPRAAQYAVEPVDGAVFLQLAFNWPKPETAIWLYDGVGEVDLAATVEAFAVSSTDATTTVAASSTVTTQHGLRIVPRRQADAAGPVDHVVVPGGDGSSVAAERVPSHLLTAGPAMLLDDPADPTYPFVRALEELAARRDLLIAQYAARELEVRLPLSLEGPRWPVRALVIATLAALAGCLVVVAIVGLVRRGRGRMARRRPEPRGRRR